MRKFIAYVIAVGLAISVQAELITFEDLGNPEIIPNGYVGLIWNNFEAFNPVAYGISGTGYNNGIISPNQIAFNENGGPAAITRVSTFNLESGYFTAAFYTGLNLEVQGYNGSDLIYDQNYSLNWTAANYIEFNFDGITKANFIASGGVPGWGYDGGTYFAMDNLTIGTVVPEPSTNSMIANSCLLLGLLLKLSCKQRPKSKTFEVRAVCEDGPTGRLPDREQLRITYIDR